VFSRDGGLLSYGPDSVDIFRRSASYVDRILRGTKPTELPVQRVIVVGGLPVHHYRAEDAVAEAYAMVFLVESGFAQQTDVARAFDRSVRTVRRHQARYVQGGMAALGREEGWRRGRRRISGQRLRSIELLKSQGMSNRAVAHRLGVSEKAIRKLVGRLLHYRPSKPRTQPAGTGSPLSIRRFAAFPQLVVVTPQRVRHRPG
jgi:transposase